MFVIGPNSKELENKGASFICLHGCAVLEMVAPIDIQPFVFQSWLAPVSFLRGKAESCLPLVKHYDRKCRMLYQNPSGHPAVLSSCELLATSHPFLSSRTTWASLVLPHLTCDLSKIFGAFFCTSTFQLILISFQ